MQIRPKQDKYSNLMSSLRPSNISNLLLKPRPQCTFASTVNQCSQMSLSQLWLFACFFLLYTIITIS